MKILLLTSKSPWPARDGGSSATVSLIDSLLLNNFTIHVLTANTRKHFSGPENIPPHYSGKINIKFVPVNTRINLLKLIFNLIFSGKPYSTLRFKSARFTSVLVNCLKDNFDIVQAEGLAIAQYLPVVKSYSRAMIIFRPHNVENRIWSMLAAEERNLLKKIYFRILSRRLASEEKRLAGYCDAIITMTEDDLSWFSKYIHHKACAVLPPALNIRLPDNKNQTGPDVAFLGSLDWIPNLKGLKWLIEKVWPLVIKKIPGTTLRIAGRNPGKIKIKGKNILFYGEVDSSAEFIMACPILVIPLFSGSGIRMRIIEGMHLGKCIIATSVAVSGISCRHRENILIADMPEEFADCIVKSLRDENFARQISLNAIACARKNYDISTAAERVNTFYKSLQ
ncbi:MAG: glycosyltransferase family 4 protein [Bacteroidales bacterium]